MPFSYNGGSVGLMTVAPFHVRAATFTADLEAITRLFRAYAESLSVDLSYQDFAAELAGLPGKYAPPQGALLLAHDDKGKALGCVALRPMGQAGICEMKRLYVSPQARGRGLGGVLVEAIMAEASRIGYREIRLDTLPDMGEAIKLYRKLGFVPIAPYYDTPIAGTQFLAKALSPAADFDPQDARR